MKTQANQRSNTVLVRTLSLLLSLVVMLGLPVFALAAPPTAQVDSYLLADAVSGDILIANKADERLFPASTTKIMTALIVLEKVPDLTKTVTAGNELAALPKDSSVMGLVKGETMSYRDLLYGLMLPSGNDAAATLAVAVGGSEAGFAQMMNDRAAALGMTGTHYVNPHGLHHADHYSTPSDIVKVTREALKNALFMQIVGTPSYTFGPTNKHAEAWTKTNTNKLVSTREADAKYKYQYAIGIKTGYTDQAKGCLVSAARKGDKTYIAVMMGDSSVIGNESMVKRFSDSIAFFDYGFTRTRMDLTDLLKSKALSTTLPGSDKPLELTARLGTTPLIKWMDDATAQALAQPGAVIDMSYIFHPAPSGEKYASPAGTVTYRFGELELFSCEFLVKEGGSTGLDGSTLTLVAVALLLLALLLVIVMIVRSVTRRRRITQARYQATRQRGKTKLRDPHDYR